MHRDAAGALQDTLDYEGKIDRGPDNINRLIAEGEKAATRFLEERAAAVAASPLGQHQTAGQAQRVAASRPGQRQNAGQAQRAAGVAAKPPAQRQVAGQAKRARRRCVLRHRARIRLTVRPRHAATDAASPPGERQAERTDRVVAKGRRAAMLRRRLLRRIALSAPQPLQRAAGRRCSCSSWSIRCSSDSAIGATFLAFGTLGILLLGLWALRARRRTLLIVGVLALLTVHGIAADRLGQHWLRPATLLVTAAFMGADHGRAAPLRAGLAADHHRQGVRRGGGLCADRLHLRLPVRRCCSRSSRAPSMPAPVHAPDDRLDWAAMMYFSFTVLTSTGFGEITPVTGMARALIVIEQVLGVMYVAVPDRAAGEPVRDEGSWRRGVRRQRRPAVPDPG